MLLLLTLSSFGAAAQSVYKCVGKGGVTSFQSNPCDGAAQVKKVWAAEPESVSNDEQSRRYNAQRKAASDAAYLRRLAHGATPRVGPSGNVVSIRDEQCVSARRRRDVYYANNPKRKSKDMERWNKFVYDACKPG
ncbi:MAG: DUF4124 domain-containing protein [Lysobacter sp.]